MPGQKEVFSVPAFLVPLTEGDVSLTVGRVGDRASGEITLHLIVLSSDGSDLVSALSASHLRFPGGVLVLNPQRCLLLREFHRQKRQSHLLVLILAPLRPITDSKARGLMEDCDLALYFVAVLSARAGASGRGDLQIREVEAELRLFRDRQHRDGNRGGMNAAFAFCRRRPLPPVTACLLAKNLLRLLALRLEREKAIAFFY